MNRRGMFTRIAKLDKIFLSDDFSFRLCDDDDYGIVKEITPNFSPTNLVTRYLKMKGIFSWTLRRLNLLHQPSPRPSFESTLNLLALKVLTPTDSKL